MKSNLRVRIVAEFLGTAFLVGGVVGSGIMAERLAGGNVALALLANTIATGAALVALILAFGPISGAHLNAVVSLGDGWKAAWLGPRHFPTWPLRSSEEFRERWRRMACLDFRCCRYRAISAADQRNS